MRRTNEKLPQALVFLGLFLAACGDGGGTAETGGPTGFEEGPTRSRSGPAQNGAALGHETGGPATGALAGQTEGTQGSGPGPQPATTDGVGYESGFEGVLGTCQTFESCEEFCNCFGQIYDYSDYFEDYVDFSGYCLSVCREYGLVEPSAGNDQESSDSAEN